MSTVAEVTGSELEEVLAGDGPVLVEFWATWCGPCRQLAPVLDRVAADFGDRLRVVKVDIDANMACAQQFSVTAVPTMILLVDGAPVWRTSGALPHRKLVEELETALA